jgi:transposase
MLDRAGLEVHLINARHTRNVRGGSGVFLTHIPGSDTSTALKIISEVGVDLACFPSVKHFTSALDCCPGTQISSSKVLLSATKPCANCAAQCLRVAAQALRTSRTALGAHHCQRALTGAAVAFHADQRRAYVEAGRAKHEQGHRLRVVQNLLRRL